MKEIFTIGASTIPGEVILPHLMPKILKQNPNISLKLVVTNSWTTFESVRKGEIEVGIIGTRYESDEVVYQMVIQDDRLVVIAPKEDPLRISVKAHSLNGGCRTVFERRRLTEKFYLKCATSSAAI